MIIQSLLDTDLYKFTMMQGVLHHFPWAKVTYEFKCRTDGVDFRPALNDINREIDYLCNLRFSVDELRYLSSLRYIKDDFVQFLRLFQLNRDFVRVGLIGSELVVDISGPWLHTILFEVPLLSIINECYYRNSGAQPDWDSGRRKLHDKILLAKSARKSGIPFVFSDFGTRRRFSKSWHDEILGILKSEIPDPCPGTSNLYFAWKKDLKPVGTMAHEWLMASQSLGPRLKDSQRFALEKWVQEYRGDLGIALSDVAGFDAFLTDFDLYFAKLFDGCRHDSGDPFSWGDRLINHYVSMNIDPRTKTAVFSDGLTFPKAVEIAEHFKGRINTSFGIGTNLTNDVSADPIQIVIKMTRCQGSPVAKLSDSPGKQMCKDPHYLAYLSHIFKGEPK